MSLEDKAKAYVDRMPWQLHNEPLANHSYKSGYKQALADLSNEIKDKEILIETLLDEIKRLKEK